MGVSIGTGVALGGGSTIQSYTWSGKPAASSVTPGTMIVISDYGNKKFYSNGTVWIPENPMWYQLPASFSTTGTTGTVTCASCTLPAGILGTNGYVRIGQHWSFTASANNKDFRNLFGGSLCTIHETAGNATAVQASHQFTVRNANSASAQLCAIDYTTGFTPTSNSAVRTLAINSANDVTLSATVAMTAADTVILRAWAVEIFPA